MAEQLDRLKHALAGRYTVERELGTGGMATVYLATDLKHKRRVAIKVVRPELAAVLGPERFLREIEISARLHHPHILPLYDSGEAEGFLYYVMPYVEGESLRDRLQREEQLSVEDAVQISREVADALSYAHSHDVVHRDVKPENILLESSHAMVADFGIARAISAAGGEHLTATGMAVGTPAYMSPEQVAGEQDLDGRSDLYSLGCVVYEMLVGHPPFTGVTGPEIMRRHSMDAVPSVAAARPSVPADIERAIATALAKTPADRYRTAAQFSEALSRSGLAAPAAAGLGPGRAAGLFAGPRGRWVGAAAVTLLAVGVAAAALQLLRRHGAAHPNQRLVVVPPFENRTGDWSLNQLGEMVAESLAAAISRDGAAEAVPAATVWQLLRTEFRGSAAPLPDLARRTGARSAVVGEYQRRGDGVEFHGALVAIPSGKTLLGFDPVAGRLQDTTLLAALEFKVLDVVRTQLEFFGDDPLLYTRPSNLEAYREFVQGREFEGRSQWPQAIEHYQRALALDTNWAFPANKLAVALSNVGERERSESLFQRLERRRNTLGPGDIDYLDWFRALQRGDKATEYRTARQWFAHSPRIGSYAMAVSALRTNRPKEVVQAARFRDTTSSWVRNLFAWYVLEAGANHLLGKHHDELKVALERRRRDPVAQNALDLEIQARAAMGQVDAVTRLLDQASTKPSGWPSGPSLAYLEFLAHGYQDAARAMLTRAMHAYETYATQAGAIRSDSIAYATALFWAHDWRPCRGWWQRLAPGPGDPWLARRYLAFCAAGQGQREEALRASQEWAAEPPQYCPGCASYYRSWVAAVLGDESSAVELLRQAFGEGYPYNLDVHRTWAALGLRNNSAAQELLRARD